MGSHAQVAPDAVGCTPVLHRMQKPDRQRLLRSHRLPDVQACRVYSPRTRVPSQGARIPFGANATDEGGRPWYHSFVQVMLIYVRLLFLDFKCRTFFWATVYVECRTAQGLFECIEAHCEAMDVPIEKIFFYASDGASVISSDRGGLAGLLRAKSAVLTTTHCLVHREALGMKDTVEQSEWAQWFDEWLHDL